jgi:hypothetical protein
MKETTAGSSLTPNQALYVVDRLVRERRIKAQEVARIAGEMQSEISAIEQRLSLLRGDKAEASKRGESKRSARPMSAAVAASRRLQGEYMGLMRHVKGRERARIKRLAAEQGREAAVREMRVATNR